MISWWLNELTTVGPEHLDEAYVDGYDTKAGFDPGPDIELLRTFGLDETSTLIDLGAGTGTFALAAADAGARVTAVDVSPVMASRLRARASQVGVETLTVVEAGFLSYQHSGPPVDYVYTRNALHQLPDFWKAVALHRVSQMIRPGGILRLRDLVFDTSPANIEETVDQWVDQATTNQSTGYTAEEFATHLKTEFSTFTWLFEPILTNAGFEILERDVRSSVYAAYVCRRRSKWARPRQLR